MDALNVIKMGFTTIKGGDGEITTDNPTVEVLLGVAVVGVAAAAAAVGGYCAYKICNDSKAAENIATVTKSSKNQN